MVAVKHMVGNSVFEGKCVLDMGCRRVRSFVVRWVRCMSIS